MMRHVSDILRPVIERLSRRRAAAVPDQSPEAVARRLNTPHLRRAEACDGGELRHHCVHGHDIETFGYLDQWFWQLARRVPRDDDHGPFVDREEALADAEQELRCRDDRLSAPGAFWRCLWIAAPLGGLIWALIGAGVWRLL